jgi:serine/threonine-protein kinase CTR1
MTIPEVCQASAEAMLSDNQIDRSELQWGDLIGSGATAQVFRGSWFDNQVTIKQLMINAQHAMQLRREVAFLREAAIIAQISHDNLVQFHGLAFDRQPYLLISEFCGGGSCYDLLHMNDDLELVMKQQLKMCCDVACAMDYLHRFKPQIIHRDLKSLSIFLVEPLLLQTDIPHAKVADVSLGKMKENPTSDSWGKMTRNVGTGQWRAPEMATTVYNEKVDVYSFSMVMFEILCEEIPFNDIDQTDLHKAVAEGERPDMDAVPPFMPADLVQLMVQCWAHNPAARPSFEYIWSVLSAISRSVN